VPTSEGGVVKTLQPAELAFPHLKDRFTESGVTEWGAVKSCEAAP
jgi:hypothetical protein